jgi:hypothetical protein
MKKKSNETKLTDPLTTADVGGQLTFIDSSKLLALV